MNESTPGGDDFGQIFCDQSGMPKLRPVPLYHPSHGGPGPSEPGVSRELLTRIEEQYLRFKRAYEDIKLRVDKREHLSFEFVELPEYVCYAREFRGATAEDSYRAMYSLHHEAVEKGYRLSATEPLFVIQAHRISGGQIRGRPGRFHLLRAPGAGGPSGGGHSLPSLPGLFLPGLWGLLPAQRRF